MTNRYIIIPELPQVRTIGDLLVETSKSVLNLGTAREVEFNEDYFIHRNIVGFAGALMWDRFGIRNTSQIDPYSNLPGKLGSVAAAIDYAADGDVLAACYEFYPKNSDVSLPQNYDSITFEFGYIMAAGRLLERSMRLGAQ